MFKEYWRIAAVRHFNFVDQNGKEVDGLSIFYSRKLYPDEPSDDWVFDGRFAPRKPAWVSDSLGVSFLNALEKSKGDYVLAVYEPRGRFNSLVRFEACDDITDDILADDEFDFDEGGST